MGWKADKGCHGDKFAVGFQRSLRQVKKATPLWDVDER